MSHSHAARRVHYSVTAMTYIVSRLRYWYERHGYTYAAPDAHIIARAVPDAKALLMALEGGKDAVKIYQRKNNPTFHDLDRAEYRA